MKNLILILSIAIIGSANAQTPVNVKRENIGITAFSYVMAYDLTQVNSTRKGVGASELKGSHYLDSCALARCIRFAKIIKSDPDKYTTNYLSILGREGHKDARTAENVTAPYDAAYVTKENIISIKESDIPSLLNKGKSGLFAGYHFYDKSEGHFKNRIDVSHKEYGSYYLVIYIYPKNCNPNGLLDYIPTRIIIHYELFSQ